MRRFGFLLSITMTGFAFSIIGSSAHAALSPEMKELAAATDRRITAEDIAVTSAPVEQRRTTTQSIAEEAPALPTEKPQTLDEPKEAPSEELVPQGETPVLPLPRGDDQLPSPKEMDNNPYLTPSAPSSLQEGVRLTPGAPLPADRSGAYVPPASPAQKMEQERSTLANELVAVLGEETYSRRVNITTPPDTEVAEVIRLLAERANLNFIYPEGVIKGRVTLNLKDVPLGVALQSLLATHGLTMVREGENVIRIMPRQQVAPGQVETRTISVRLNWVPAPDLERMLIGFITPGSGGMVRAHRETNTLVVTATPNAITIIRDLIAQLDVPEKQVMIEARMAELQITNGRSLGSATTIERRDGSGNSPVLGTVGENAAHTETNQTITIDPNTGKPVITDTTVNVPAVPVDQFLSNLLVGNGAPSVSFGTVISIFGREYDVAATLDALETRNVVHTLVNPKVVTLNNQRALIEVLRENPYFETQQGVAGDVVGQTVKFKNSGVTLTVLPNITNNGFVRLTLEPEQMILAGLTRTDVPIINRRHAITNVIVKDEDTVVLGGLRELDGSDTKSEFPWIGQIPIFGWFFKRDSKTLLKNELMLFVTPHIIKAPVLAPAENYMYSRVDAHWDLPDFFFDDGMEIREEAHRGEMNHSAKDHVPMTLKLPPAVEQGAGAVGTEQEVGAEKAKEETIQK